MHKANNHNVKQVAASYMLLLVACSLVVNGAIWKLSAELPIACNFQTGLQQQA